MRSLISSIAKEYTGVAISRYRRWLPLGLLLVLIFVLPTFGQAREEQAQHTQTEPNRAGLVIRHGDGRVITACVSFSEPSISGLELLQRAGVPFLAQQGGIGAAVCKIDGEGCDYPAEDCFCKRDGPKTIYWAYNRLTPNGWMLSSLGASNTKVQSGDVEGWAWGTGSVNSGAQPPLVSFDEVCQAQASSPVPPTSTPTLTPRPSVTPQPTATPQPTDTPQPTATPQPSATPQPTATPVPTRVAASPTATSIPKTPTITPVLPTTTPQPTTIVPTVEAVAPTELPTEVPELALAATSMPTPQPPSATPVLPSATATPVPTSTPRRGVSTTLTLPAPTLVAPTNTSVPTSAPPVQATPEGAGGVVPQPEAPQNGPSNYIVFAVLACALISAILAIYALRKH